MRSRRTAIDHELADIAVAIDERERALADDDVRREIARRDLRTLEGLPKLVRRHVRSTSARWQYRAVLRKLKPLSDLIAKNGRTARSNGRPATYGPVHDAIDRLINECLMSEREACGHAADRLLDAWNGHGTAREHMKDIPKARWRAVMRERLRAGRRSRSRKAQEKPA